MTKDETQSAPATGVVVIPALNEERAIRAVAEAALRVCAKVIVVDDGSSDGTSAAVAGLAVELIRHTAPQGKAMALRDGFRRALELGADGVLTMDGDGQHAAADLPRLLAAAGKYPNHVVIGARLLGRDAQPDKNRFGNAQADFWVSWACGQRIVDSQSGQRYYPRAAIDIALALPHDGFVFESEILIECAAHGIRTVSVPIKASYEEERRASHFKPVRDVVRITRMIAGRLLRGGLMLGNLRRSRKVAPIVVDMPAM
ncbi:MAG: glycosyltransferase family 2 protein [Rudaea sp.]|uniref:glycosyltransferase family 2 protein n=1 Tax=Rudaea sp. TaxID=2136325 RepID=UPI0039E43F36